MGKNLCDKYNVYGVDSDIENTKKRMMELNIDRI